MNIQGLLQLTDYEGEGVLSCVGLLLFLKILVSEPLPGKEGGQEDPKMGERQGRQVQFGDI